MSRKKWGKSATKTEKIIRDAVPKPEVLSGIEEYLSKTRSVTCYDIANRFNIRMSVARKILREKEAKGDLVPYVREGGFIVYTTPSEMEKREGGVPIMTATVFEEVASSVNSKPVITEEMDEALVAAGTPGAVKPSKLARQRRERGERKERKDDRPEVIVEPLESKSEVVPEREPEVTMKTVKKVIEKKEAAKKEAAKKPDAKKPAEKKEAAKKEAAKKPDAKKPAEKKEAAKKDAAKKPDAKKPAEKKEAAKKEAAKKPDAKKPAEKKEAKPKKEAAKKPDAKKPAEKKEAKPKKEAAKKPADKKTTKK